MEPEIVPARDVRQVSKRIELSRRFRALKLWLSIRYHGLAAFRAAIAENLAQANSLST